MHTSRSIVGIAVGVASLVLVVAGAISYRAVEQLAQTGDAVSSAKELELSLERLLSTLRDAETGQRGYLLSGSEEYLAPYDAALRELEARLTTVDARLQASSGSAADMPALRALVRPETARAVAHDRPLPVRADHPGARDRALRRRQGRHGRAAQLRRRARRRRTHARRPAARVRRAGLARDDPFQHRGERAGHRADDRPHLRRPPRFGACSRERSPAGDDAAQHRRRGDHHRRPRVRRSRSTRRPNG